MTSHRQQRLVSTLLVVLCVAVLALAIAQSAGLQPVLPASIVTLPLTLLWRPMQARAHTFPEVHALPQDAGRKFAPHDPMPPPSASIA
jgi:hypothetical protein